MAANGHLLDSLYGTLAYSTVCTLIVRYDMGKVNESYILSTRAHMKVLGGSGVECDISLWVTGILLMV